jgi:SAM-dependent methyltransferase
MTNNGETTTILNLGCGNKTHPEIVNIDWSIHLRLRRSTIGRALASRYLRGERKREFDKLPSSILVHDLTKGIPYPNSSVDAVYHSHTLEHIDRSAVPVFFAEVLRVLKPGGIHRICVPDFESLVLAYIGSLQKCRCTEDADSIGRHDFYISDIIEQMVRKQASGTGRQTKLRQIIENGILGDARRRGETHRWMYDQYNLSSILLLSGFSQVRRRSYNVSEIPDWTRYGLELDDDGREYKAGSLYIEARR